MRGIRKSSLLVLAGLAMATPAAATTSAFVALQNLNAANAVTLSSVTWSGAYSPQLPTTINPGAGAGAVGRLTETFTGPISLTFIASFTDTPANNCLFSFTMNGGVITVAGFVQH